MRNIRLGIVIFIGAVLAPLTAVGVATVATRTQGVFFAQRSSSPLPPSPSPLPGFYNDSNVLRACGGRSDAGTQSCYPVASPWPSPSPEPSDTFVAGSGTAILTDSKSTGGIGTTNYTFQDLVYTLKVQGIIVP